MGDPQESEHQVPETEGPETVVTVCIYMPTKLKFRSAYEKCKEGGFLLDGRSLEEAELVCEFLAALSLPAFAGEAPYQVEHIVRLPEHPEYSLAALDPLHVSTPDEAV